ncbi:MAG: aspartate dehydrogenase [Methanobrevibacter sp.]
MILGFLGCGNISSFILNYLIHSNLDIQPKYFFDKFSDKSKSLSSLVNGVVVKDFNRMLNKVDIVFEAASPSAIKEYGLNIVNSGKSLIIMSVGSLMDKNFREDLIQVAEKKNVKIYVPSGAVIGLDGIKSASIGNLYSISLITRKPPKALNQNENIEKVVFEGKASEAIKKFPLNMNVAVSLSLVANKDIDVKIISDPSISQNIHQIDVKGDFGQFSTRISNLPCKSNPKTSLLAAYSAINLFESLNKNLYIGV